MLGSPWQHALGDQAPDALLSFAGGASFRVIGATLSRDATLLSFGLAYRLASGGTVTAGYSGALGTRGAENIGRIGLAFGF